MDTFSTAFLFVSLSLYSVDQLKWNKVFTTAWHLTGQQSNCVQYKSTDSMSVNPKVSYTVDQETVQSQIP